MRKITEIKEIEEKRIPVLKELFEGKGCFKHLIYLITGIPKSGKSLIAYQITSQISRYKPILYITSETPSKILKLAFEKAQAKLDNVYVADFSNRPSVKELLNELKRYDGEYVIIDSLTSFYEYEEMKLRKLMVEVKNVLREKDFTTWIIGQKRSSHQENTSETAGGYAIAHSSDAIIVVMKDTVSRMSPKQIKEKFGIGNTYYSIRVDGCVLGGFSKGTYVFEITENPLGIRIVGEISEMINGGQ